MKLISKFEKRDKKEAKRIQRRLLLSITEYFSSFDLEDGKIKSTVANIRKASSVTRLLQRKFKEKFVLPLINKIVKSLITSVLGQNDRYFNEVVGDKSKVSEASKKSARVIKLELGVKTNVQSDSELFADADIADVWKTIRRDAINAATNGNISIQDFQSRMKDYIEGAGKNAGQIEKHFARVTGDIYNKYERTHNANLAESLGLRHAIYQGGLIKTSRDFCEVRNNKVFSLEEILLFGTSADKFGGYTNKSRGEFQGKTNPYDAIRDLGGHNCRHRLDWVTATFAYRLRPELRPKAA